MNSSALKSIGIIYIKKKKKTNFLMTLRRSKKPFLPSDNAKEW